MSFTYKYLRENMHIYKNCKRVVPLKCDLCSKTFTRIKRNVINKINNPNIQHTYCSIKCSATSKSKEQTVQCAWCNKIFQKKLAQIKKSVNNFCSHSCAASYNNTHKKHGTRRSKLEKWLEPELKLLYPKFDIDFNKKDAINSELDIYVPDLNLAFELNGIFHYEPIFGQNKLASIQNNDDRKFQACLEQNIELCIIDVSSLNYFKPDKAQKFLDIICNIINKKT